MIEQEVLAWNECLDKNSIEELFVQVC